MNKYKVIKIWKLPHIVKWSPFEVIYTCTLQNSATEGSVNGKQQMKSNFVCAAEGEANTRSDASESDRWQITTSSLWHKASGLRQNVVVRAEKQQKRLRIPITSSIISFDYRLVLRRYYLLHT